MLFTGNCDLTYRALINGSDIENRVKLESRQSKSKQFHARRVRNDTKNKGILFYARILVTAKSCTPMRL